MSEDDAPANALVKLHLLSCVLPMSFDESPEQLQKLFEPMTGLLYEPALGERSAGTPVNPSGTSAGEPAELACIVPGTPSTWRAEEKSGISQF